MVVKQIRLGVVTNFYSVSCLVALLLVAPTFFGQSASQTVPRLVQYSGVAKDTDGKPMTGTIGITFLLYKDQQSGAPLWLETQNAQADSKGKYTVLLGSSRAEGLPTDLFSSGEARWLGVEILGQAEQPRVLFVSVPYALKAADAETIGGLLPSAFVRTTPPGDNPDNSSAAATNSAPSATAAVSGSGTTNFLPIWKTSTSLSNSTLFETGGKVGIGTTTPAVTLDINGSAAVRGNQNVTGNLGIGTTPPATGPLRLQVATNNQLGAVVQGPFSGVGAGLQLQTTGTGGKQWEILATGAKAAQGPGKLNIRNINDGQDVLTIDAFDTVNVLNLNSTGEIVDQGNLFVNGATVMSIFGMTSQGPIGIGLGKPAPLAALDILSNNVHTLVGGVPGCNTGFSGIGFGTAGLSDCAHYSLVGDGLNTFLNRPSGGTMHLREGNADQVVILPGGSVGVGTTAPQEKLDVNGRVRSQNLAVAASLSSQVNASSGKCLGALLSAKSACDTPNLSLTETTGDVPVFIIANLNGILDDTCVVANFGLVMDGNIIAASNTAHTSGFALSSLTMVSLQFPAPGTHTFEVQESDDTAGCSGFSLRTLVGSASNTSSNFSTSTLIVREY
jgi:hypothetical protein